MCSPVNEAISSIIMAYSAAHNIVTPIQPNAALKQYQCMWWATESSISCVTNTVEEKY